MAEAPRERMCLELERTAVGVEPQVLVALRQEESDLDNQPNTQGPTSFVAVGDAPTKTACSRFDALLSSSGMAVVEGMPGGLHLVSAEGLDAATVTSLRRSYSDPELVTATARYGSEVEVVSSSDATSSSRPGQPVSKSKNSSSSSSCVSSPSSGGTKVLIGSPNTNTARRSGIPAASFVRMSDVRALPQGPMDERLSYGSLQHVLYDERCKPCIFARKGTCKHGSLCEFCHVSHHPYVKNSRRKHKNGPRYPRTTGHDAEIEEYHLDGSVNKQLVEVVINACEVETEMAAIGTGASSSLAMTAADTETCRL
eukprot:gnl/TRDRNA2_/TRDRNA2_133064_c1_seq1.p1 gnl/TRDRNA2_/TRDRNA2_133064_c1~~gnl/TRDRNA2_/TRDRNA2_133064_c1_seq1.p1  ORF type:complete len:343 (-),score=31.37 gnl/TRDRNA2_/TRDRNA2_133064_c1_seq1:3-938(-)